MAAEFRNDINGLRAYAVLAVMLYHFGVGFMPGGFIGVDVFFVLSGFLMTGIIAGGLEKGRFSIGLFYLGRARRIGLTRDAWPGRSGRPWRISSTPSSRQRCCSP